MSDPQNPTEPSTTLFESAILESRRGAFPIEELMRAFMDTEFVIPSTTPISEKLSDLNPPIWQIDGEPNLGVFTTPSRAAQFREEAPYLAVISGRRLAEIVAADMWIAVNPTSPDYMFRIPPEAIVAARERFG